MKVIKDFKKYLDIIDKLSKPLDKEQKKQLENILSVMLTLLVSLKQTSKLGITTFKWDNVEVEE